MAFSEQCTEIPPPPSPPAKIAVMGVRLDCAARSHSAAIAIAVIDLCSSDFCPPPLTSILMMEMEHDSETLARLAETINQPHHVRLS